MIESHTLSLGDALQDLKRVESDLQELEGTQVNWSGGNRNREAVASVTRTLLHCQHLLDAVKVVIGDEYWSIRGRA